MPAPKKSQLYETCGLSQKQWQSQCPANEMSLIEKGHSSRCTKYDKGTFKANGLSEKCKCMDPCCTPTGEKNIWNRKKGCMQVDTNQNCTIESQAGIPPSKECKKHNPKQATDKLRHANAIASNRTTAGFNNAGNNAKKASAMGLESFRNMDPMETSYGIVSYGENYSLVAFGLFTLLMILYKASNNK